MASLKILRMKRRAMRFEITRCGTRHLRQIAELARDERGVAHGAGPDDAVYPLTHQVYRPVSGADVKLDVGIAHMVLRQRRNQE